MSGIYEGPDGNKLYGDGKEVRTVDDLREAPAPTDRDSWPEPLKSIALIDLTNDALIDWLGYCANKSLFWGELREEMKRRIAEAKSSVLQEVRKQVEALTGTPALRDGADHVLALLDRMEGK